MDPKSTIAKALNNLTESLAKKAGHMTHAKGATLNSAGVSYAEDLIRAGKIDKDGEWSFGAADGDKLLGSGGDDWDNYEKHFLAVDNDQPEKTRGHSKYPFSVGDTISVPALNAIRSRASQQGADSIFAAAGKLLDLIKAKDAA